jgi:hypothetical protein
MEAAMQQNHPAAPCMMAACRIAAQPTAHDMQLARLSEGATSATANNTLIIIIISQQHIACNGLLTKQRF